MLRGQRAALTISADVDQTSSEIVVAIEGMGQGQTVRLSLTNLLAAFDSGMSPLILLACAAAARRPLSPSWRPILVGGASPPPTDVIGAHLSSHRRSAADDEVDAALNAGNDVILVGTRGVGKTAVLAAQADAYLRNGDGVVWLDLLDPADGPEAIISELFYQRQRDRYLIVVDRVEANLPAIERIFACTRELRSVFGLNVLVIAASWPGIVAQWREPFAAPPGRC